ncbi:MAG: hypothetical protein WAQ53_16545 [Thiofilum sp.]|uniref:hypothetical protein n=1 Tax=Thiofilum sp. TaxID=2212733 RepID=UPI002600DFB5|nr:hypothetical protein [Thiofilum sp.]MBK8452458.1 hypothetical protein [Thiofilum sp.]
MFKQNKLAIGVAAGVLVAVGIFTGVQAVHINPDGTGQVLLFPYFNANPGYVTNINLVNSTNETKAVKIRFREGKNSNDILNFNIYMSPEDVWTGTIRKDSQSDAGAFTTLDRTCTMPIQHAADCATPDRCEVMKTFDGKNIIYENKDTREGYVEVIEMGVVTDPVIQAAVKHAKGKPTNCQEVANAWTKGVFTSGAGSSAAGLKAPTGGLFGSSAVLNVAEGAAFTIDPVAIDNYSTEAQHYRPDVYEEYLLPSLASGNITQSTITVPKPNGESDMVVTNWKQQKTDPCLVEGTRCGTNPYPMAHVLAVPYIMNEYFLDPTDGYDGHTDWVVTFPMKKHGIYREDTDIAAKIDSLYDREETRAWNLNNAQDKYFGFLMDAKAGTFGAEAKLTREVNVLSFVSTDPSYDLTRTVFSSPSLKTVMAGPFVHGWARITFPNYTLGGSYYSSSAYGANPLNYKANSFIYNGVPTLGFAAIEGNVSQNAHARFGDAIPHKTRRY